MSEAGVAVRAAGITIGPSREGGFPLGAIFAIVAAAAAAAVGLLHLDHLPWTACFFKAFTGWPCPTCGSTRALGRLFALDLPGALAMNPLAALGALALLPWAAADALLLLRGRALALSVSPGGARVLRSVVVLLVAANWLYLLGAER
jgi:hypothetical protein